MNLSVVRKPIINFYNFPHDFDRSDNIFLDLVQIVRTQSNDFRPIDFYGCYPNKGIFRKGLLFLSSRKSDRWMTKWLNLQQGITFIKNKNALNIWCTFENRRPPSQGFDLTLTFDKDDFDATNLYLPLLYHYLKIDSELRYTPKHDVIQSDCLNSRNVGRDKISKKVGFVSAFINNPQPTRLKAINKLSKIARVEVFGRSVSRYVPDKIGTAEKYWFNLCFENDLYPGYVTEKVLEAWLSFSIPLYWGIDECEILNPSAIVNLHDFDSMEDFVEYISNLYKDQDRMLEMIRQPILKKGITTEALTEFIKAGLELKASL
jgi:hypothetical protein